MFKYPLRVLDASGATAAVFDTWVDTATAYTWLPLTLAQQLGVELTEERVFVLADGTRQRKPVAQVRISLGGPAFYTYCAFVEEGEELLLGAVALEEAGLAVDPVYKRLVPVERYALTRITP